jgi:hypothetical protein
MTAGPAALTCQNTPLLAQVSIEVPLAPSQLSGNCPRSSLTVQPPHLLTDDSGMAVQWMRLKPFALTPEQLAGILQRSHHAMLWLRSTAMNDATSTSRSQVQVHDFLLWGGFDAFMALKNDMWVVHVYPPHACEQLQSRGSVNMASWCWTAEVVHQLGHVPSGRAYAKLALMQVCCPDHTADRQPGVLLLSFNAVPRHPDAALVLMQGDMAHV